MKMVESFDELIKQGKNLLASAHKYIDGDHGDEDNPEYISWRLQAITAIKNFGKLGKDLLSDFESDNTFRYYYSESVSHLLGILDAALAIAKKQSDNGERNRQDHATLNSMSSNDVFVVHGHDEKLRHQVARFLEGIGAKPIILFEQVGKSRTIIEKLEANSNVSFAIVLLTPDDIGKEKNDNRDLHPRARQNVILELGYFLGKLGRSNIAVLYDESVEPPSDFHGVDYIKIDPNGAWKHKLARELKEAGLTIDLNKVII